MLQYLCAVLYVLLWIMCTWIHLFLHIVLVWIRIGVYFVLYALIELLQADSLYFA